MDMGKGVFGLNIARLRNVVQCLYFMAVVFRFHGYVRPLLIAFIPLALFFGNFFCGWICPLGALQEWLGRIGSCFCKKRLSLPSAWQRYAQYARYLILAAFLLLVGFSAISAAFAESLPVNAYKSFSLLAARRSLSVPAAVFFASVLFLSLFSDRPFCNYLCANGVRYALPAWARVFTIKRNASSCVNCKMCDRACPMHVAVSQGDEVRDIQCVNCFRCADACPVPQTLSYGVSNTPMERIRRKIKGKSAGEA